MERNIRKRLPIHPKPKRARWWSFEWLPSMAMVYTLGGSAAALLIFCAATVFLAGNKPPAASNQLARTEADIWTHPAPQRRGAEPAIGLGSMESSERFPANTARNEPHSVEREATPAGEPRPNSQPVPAIPVLPGETGRPSARSGIIAASSENASASVHRISVELSAGMQARIQILLARQESGSTIVEAALTTPSSTTAPSVIFSARVAEDSAPVRLQIHMLEQDGRRMSLHDGEINSVIVRWPDSERKPLPGQSFEVQVLSGATLESQAERK